jgi:hypothetical protein
VCNATVMDTAAKLCSGGGIDVCVNARIAPDRRLGDMADEDMNQVADSEFKHCKLAGHACNSAVAVPGRDRVMRTVSRTGRAIVPGSGQIPAEFAVALDAD